MLIVHKPMIVNYGRTDQSHQVNFKINLSNGVECSFAFDDSVGRMQSCGQNYLIVTDGYPHSFGSEDELYNLYSLDNDTLQTIIGLACLDNWIALKAVLDGQI